jgi:predicted DNA-binding transcriptional regulator YafY
MIDSLIGEGKYPNTGKLTSELEVTTRTIQRDIEYMRDMFGLSIEYNQTSRGFYCSEPNFSLKASP